MARGKEKYEEENNGPYPLRYALCALLLCLAQQPKKVPRIGYLSSFDPARESTRSEAIRLALRERGHIEGQNIAIEYRYSEGKTDRAPELSAELVRLKVDIIVVAGGTPRVRAAKNATKTIPVVMAGNIAVGSDPVCKQPGGKPGITNLTGELRVKRLELSHNEAGPKVPVSRFLRSGRSESLYVIGLLQSLARATGVDCSSWEVRRLVSRGKEYHHSSIDLPSKSLSACLS